MKRLIAAVIIAATIAMSGCSAQLSETGEPLSVAQAEQLAGARFALYAQGDFTVELTLRDPEDIEHATATLTIDPETHRAWGELASGPEGLATVEPIALTPTFAAVERDGTWRAAELPSSTLLALQSVFQLASDRPENAQLLRQSDATHLGSASENGERLEVFRLPSSEGAPGASSTRLWLTDQGQVRRFDGGTESPLVLIVGAQTPTADTTPSEVWAALDGQ